MTSRRRRADAEAAVLAEQVLEGYRAMSYGDLCALLLPEDRLASVTAASGRRLTARTEAF